MLTSSRVQLFIIILVILTLLTLSCGGKGQEIREMTAEKLQGVAEKLADEGTSTPASSPTTESIPTDVSPVTSLPTAPPTTMPASVPTAEPTPTSPAVPTVEPTPTAPAVPTVEPIPTSPTIPAGDAPDSYKIAFLSTRTGNMDIYVMNADGTGQLRLTTSPSDEANPVWSPSGTKIAFYSNQDGNTDVYVMNADGTGQTRLTQGIVPSWDPSWSSDGTRIAFSSERDDNIDIYVMNSDGSDVQRITDDQALDRQPSWSPDDTKITFASARDGNEEIYVMNTDGSDQTRLTNNLARDMNPSWSPDGDRIAFNSNLPDINAGLGEGHEIFVMSTNGSNLIRLTKSPDSNGSPSWSPDGAKIAFSSYLKDGDNEEIYVMNADGTGLTRLTDSIGIDASPSWSPLVETSPTPSATPTADAPIPIPTIAPPSAIPASITVEPQSAEPGQVVTISGTGFQPYTTVHQLAINPSGMDSISVLSYPTPSTNAAGEFTTDMLIFSLPNGDHEVAVTVAGTSTTATFTVTGSTYLSGIDYPAASINVEPVSAAPGAVVTITGSGFPPFGLVQQLRLRGINVLPVPQPHTDSAGNLETQIMVPKLGLGNAQAEIVIAGTSASIPITIVSDIPASIKVEPQSAEPGEWVTITGTGFPPFTTIASFTLGGISVLPPFPIATEASGEFTTDVLMPALPNGDHIVVVTVGGTSTTATFTVTGSP